MPEYAFDVKLWATARVEAETEEKAREILANVVSCLDVSLDAHGVKIAEACAEGDYDLVEIDGEAV